MTKSTLMNLCYNQENQISCILVTTMCYQLPAEKVHVAVSMYLQMAECVHQTRRTYRNVILTGEVTERIPITFSTCPVDIHCSWLQFPDIFTGLVLSDPINIFRSIQNTKHLSKQGGNIMDIHLT